MPKKIKLFLITVLMKMKMITLLYCKTDMNLVRKVKAIYDWAVLADILNGESYISFAKVKTYGKNIRMIWECWRTMLKKDVLTSMMKFS